MNILKFIEQFPTEASCRRLLRNNRERQGITCKNCKSTNHFWLENFEKWQCRKCKSRTNLRAGTIFEQSKLPLRDWFITIHLILATKKTISLLELQRQLGYKRYEPVWYMKHKINIFMGKCESKYQLKGQIELDDAFFTTVNTVPLKKDDDLNTVNEMLKRGRGSQKKLKVLVITESSYNPGNKKKHRPSRALGRVKMIVMDNLKSKTINYEVQKHIDHESYVLTDGFKGYYGLKKVIKKHKQMVVPPKEAGKKLPWVHKIISNSKRLLLGIHHSVGKEYLQNYLNEFTYKLNRRYNRETIFEDFILSGSNETWY